MAHGSGQANPPQPHLPIIPAGEDSASVWYSGAGPASAGPYCAGVNPSWLAASADRERTVGVLRAGFAEGRLTQDELDDRVGRAYAARTYADLWALTADLPAGPLPYPTALPYQHGAVVPHRAEPPDTWRSAAALVITALLIFTIAALLTAIATAHAQPGLFPQLQQVQQPQQFQNVNLAPFVMKPHRP